jgi:hypothetical protein
MHEATYDIRSGTIVSERNTGSALAPGDMAQPDALQPKPPRFSGAPYDWTPSASPDDPHDVDYDKTPTGMFEPLYGAGPVSSNISDGNPPPGPFSSVARNWNRPGPAADPHAVA